MSPEKKSKKRGRQPGTTEGVLREALGRMQSLIEDVPIGLYRSTPEGRILDVNPAFVQMLDFPDAPAILAKNSRDLYANPEDRERYASLLDQHGVVRDFEVQLRRFNGEIVWASLNTRAVRDAEGRIAYYQGAVQDISLRKRAEGVLREREGFISTLNDITRAALESWEFESMLQTLADRLAELFGASGCYVTMWDEAQQLPIAGAAAGSTRDDYPRTQAQAGEPTITASVLSAGHALVIDDTRNTPYLSQRIASLYPHKSALGLPLISGHYKLGAAIIAFDEPHRFTEGEIERGEQAARQIALAIAKARMLAESERRAEELSALVRMGNAILRTRDLDERLEIILREIMTFLQTEYGAVFLTRGKEVDLSVDSGLSPIVRTAFQELARLQPDSLRTPRVVRGESASDTGLSFARQTGMRAWAIIPLHLPAWAGADEPEWLGSIIVGSTDSQVLSETRMRAVSRMVVSASLAIGHTQANHEAQNRLIRLRALRDIDMAITSSLDLRVTLKVLLSEVTSQLRVDAAAVLLLNRHTGTFDLTAARGLREELLANTRLLPGQNHAGQAASERRIIHVADLSKTQIERGRLAAVARDGFRGYFAVPLVAKGQARGILELFHRSPLDPEPEWMEFLEGLTAHASIAVDSAATFDELQRANTELFLAYDRTLEGWVKALDLRDKETEGHSRRVTELTVHLARAMNLDDVDLPHIRRGALLHDIGKMGIPDAILLKPGPLTEEEWKVMHLHPAFAFEMLSPISFLLPALDIPFAHHEKWDGTGYPRGLRAEQIPLAARIFAVVDVWDALRFERPYRAAWPEEKVREYIAEQAGKQFDAQVVDAFLNLEIPEIDSEASAG